MYFDPQAISVPRELFSILHTTFLHTRTKSSNLIVLGVLSLTNLSILFH